MAATYASLKARVLSLLNDATAVRYVDDSIQESMRQALVAYNASLPSIKSAVITVATAGVTLSLSTLTSLTKVLFIIYPYTAGMEEKPTQGIQFFLHFDDGVPFLYTPLVTMAVGEKIKLLYFSTHTIDDLDSASVTTIPPHHESVFCDGVAAFACQLRAHALLEAYGDRTADYQKIMDHAKAWEDRFNTFLAQNSPAQSFFFPSGFKLDEWDEHGL